MKIIGVDFGTKKSGIAEAKLSKEAFLAFPLKVVFTSDLLSEIEHISPEIVVLGHSLNLQGNDNPIMQEIDTLAQTLKQKGIKVVFIDERFTTQQTHALSRLLKHKDKNYKSKSGPVDAQSATLILQTFLDKLFSKNKMI